jgi:cyclophilin family peptidyl-prolyl cis-trans isomerase
MRPMRALRPMRSLPLAGALTLALVLGACASDPTPTPKPSCPTEPPTSVSAQATLEGASLATVRVTGAVQGEFAIELLPDAAPLATANFVALARCGFYDGVWFHRVIAGFVAQAGDPQTRGQTSDFETLGQGGPGYSFEIEPPPDDVPFDHYTVAMANNRIGNGSQFFITLDDLDQALRSVGVYSIFGRVVSGLDVVDQIAAVPVNDPRVGVPLSQVTIETIEISSGEAPEASGAGG